MNQSSSDMGEVSRAVLAAFLRENPSRVEVEEAAIGVQYYARQEELYLRLGLPPQIFDGRSVIDWGCGTGEATLGLARWGANGFACDFNAVSVSRAEALFQADGLSDAFDFSTSAIERYTPSVDSVDFSVSLGVIAHVENAHVMFSKMARHVKCGGFLVLGYVETAGLIQRWLHRAIIHGAAPDDYDQRELLASKFFPEHLRRSVELGGRSERSVINDYLVNPQYVGLDRGDLLAWGISAGLTPYSAYPSLSSPLLIDHPVDGPAYQSGMVEAVSRLRWMFAASPDAEAFRELERICEPFSNAVDDLLVLLEKAISYESVAGQEFQKQGSGSLTEEFSRAASEVVDAARQASDALSRATVYELDHRLAEVGAVLDYVDRVREKADQTHIDSPPQLKSLFRGYNGLGTSYLVFRRAEHGVM